VFSLSRAQARCFEVPYPAAARGKRETGRVIVAIHVSETGQVHDTEVIVSSGHPNLDRAVVNQFNTCKVNPATKDGVPTTYSSQLAYVFNVVP
jgi:TonB family protein